MPDVEFDTDVAQTQLARPQAAYTPAYQAPGSAAHNKRLMVGIILVCLIATIAILFYASRRGSQADSIPWQIKLEKMQDSFGAGTH